MLNLAAIFIGGGTGAVIRYSISLWLKSFGVFGFPFATFFVNIIGCFLIGFFAIFFLSKPDIPSPLKALLTIGFCGGLTTFSTFSLENFELLNNGKINLFIIYIFLSFIICILMTYLGAYLANKI